MRPGTWLAGYQAVREVQRATAAGGHPEQIPAAGRTVYPQSHASGAFDGTGDFDSARRGGPAQG